MSRMMHAVGPGRTDPRQGHAGGNWALLTSEFFTNRRSWLPSDSAAASKSLCGQAAAGVA